MRHPGPGLPGVGFRRNSARNAGGSCGHAFLTCLKTGHLWLPETQGRGTGSVEGQVTGLLKED